MPSVKEIIALAESVGLHVVKGTKHHKILTPEGRQVAVVPLRHARGRGRHGANVTATIRRAGRTLE